MKIEPDILESSTSLKAGIAKLISNFGNPFTLIFLFTVFSTFHFLPVNKAIKISIIILFIALIPTGLFIIYNVKKGTYTNYDVSNQKQRPSLYLFSLSVLIFIIAVLVFNQEPKFIIGGGIAAFILLLISFLVNMKVKCSLHTSFAVFIALAFLHLNLIWSFGLLLFAFFMGWSRLILRRHTIGEVMIGGILGSTVGLLFYIFIRPYTE